ncbi:hypothetical protein GCM10007320_41420 [Pseudorhodoferax aquiterrae]|uniref:DUF2938 family protein n=1 Tax=Pseudorhodoferax aquiterrae TaxID=747304 RepID=A0ABQ3G688_9BURK|nr:hypothetical protein GCM10007320_41420 [Pseudorhodoferax aquiterrae]
MPSPLDRPAARATAVHALVAGSLASLLSCAVLAWAGRRENASAAAPLNAVSHWYWDDEALQHDGVDAAHTATGYATHHATSVFWAGLFALACRRQPALRRGKGALMGSAATSALACFVDFQLTPRRFTPGFEHRLSRPALAGVYAAFALGLALGTAAVERRRNAAPAAAPPGQLP